MPFLDLAIPCPLRRSFTYRVPEGIRHEPGTRAIVEFRRRRTTGIVLSSCDTPPDGIDTARIKEVLKFPDDGPAISRSMMDLILWMSSYYFAPIGEAMRAALPTRLINPGSPKTTKPKKPAEITPLDEASVELNQDQADALSEIQRAAGEGKHTTFLLHGVTGSGKTEVYLRLFETLVKEGKQGLLLVPEIGLTPQLAGRAAARFGDRIAVYHSGLTDAQRHAQWRRIKDGLIDVVIGTRSALFAPLSRLGAIVVDEEHDSSYKQDEGFTYNGRDCAIMRAHIERIPCVLGSATPSVESAAHARSGKYKLRTLPSRTGIAVMPSIEITDMRKKSSSRDGLGLFALSPRLHNAISETLERGEQALLFVGRRGFASSIHCEACGEVPRCPNCDISLTAHTGPKSDFLSCHYCDYKIPYPEGCPSCGSIELRPMGFGTQRLTAELADFFPNARVARLDSDTAASRKERNRIFRGMRRGEIDILVGTQMVTKGHDFPGITLVGVISADNALNIPDFRSAERTLQLLTQVAGRAGRGERPGRVIIQTWQPEHPSLAAAARLDFNGFLDTELAYRKKAGYPPFARIACVRISSLKADEAEDVAHKLAQSLKRATTPEQGIEILGPAPAPIEKIRNRFRWHILIKAGSAPLLSSFLSKMDEHLDLKTKSGVRVAFDMDPLSLL